MPADSDGHGPATLPRSYRPLGTRVVAAIAAVGMTVAMAFLWESLPASVQADFTAFQRLTLLGFFAVTMVVLFALFRTSARADDSGLRVVNGYRTRRLEWAEIVSVSLHPNRPWAMLDLADGGTVAVMAIQNADGARAARSARELAGVIAERSPSDRDT